MKIAFTTTALLAVAGMAQAEIRPYVGADYVYTAVDYEAGLDSFLDDGLHGVSPYAGLQFNKYVGAEVSYLRTEEAKKNPTTGVDGKVRLSGYALDVVGTLPVTADESVALLGSVGVGRYDAKASISGPGGSIGGSDNDTGYRVGVGAQYQINPCWGVRAMARYIDVDFDGLTDNLVQGTLGVNYKF